MTGICGPPLNPMNVGVLTIRRQPCRTSARPTAGIWQTMAGPENSGPAIVAVTAVRPAPRTPGNGVSCGDAHS